MFLKLLCTYELPRDLVQNKNSDPLGLGKLDKIL